MPDTGAPWNIPFLDGTELVRAYPDFSEDLADAVADGLSAAGNAGIGSNVVQTVKTDHFQSTSTTFIPLPGLSVTITPSTATSKILVMADLHMSASAIIFVQLFRGATRIYQGQDGTNTPFNNWNATTVENFAQSNTRETRHPTKVFLDSPETTSPVTYSLEARVDTGTMFLNRQGLNTVIGAVSSITVIEVSA